MQTSHRHPCHALWSAVAVLGLLPAGTPLAPGRLVAVRNECSHRGGIARADGVAAQVIEHDPYFREATGTSDETRAWCHGPSSLPAPMAELQRVAGAFHLNGPIPLVRGHLGDDRYKFLHVTTYESHESLEIMRRELGRLGLPALERLI